MSKMRQRLEAVVESVASTLSEDECIEVRGLIEAGEQRIGLEQLVRFLLDRDAVVEGWIPAELRTLAEAYRSDGSGLEMLQFQPPTR